jgi:glycine/D-amino acid oxidase-like deaminating enzyme
MMRKQSILVVGGGVFGVSAALELALRGHEVSLMDPGPIPRPAAASTDINKALRMDYGADELYLSLMEEAFVIWDKWNTEWNVPVYHEDGFLVMTQDPIQAGGFEHDSLAMLSKHGHIVQRLNSKIIKSRFPAWNSEKYVDGYFNLRAGWAESGRVVARLLQEAIAAGVLVRQGLSAVQICENNREVTGVIASDKQQYTADIVVLATGTWSPLLAERLKDIVHHIAQPVFYFRPRNADLYRAARFPVWAADISRTGWYGFPLNKDGILKISNHGPGRKVHPDEKRQITPDDVQHCRKFLSESLPGLTEEPFLDTKTCLYCDTWDGDFYIDRDPELPALVYATGGSGHAFKFTPVLGRLVADVVEHKTNAYTSRFAWRPQGAVRVKEWARFQG